MEISRLSISPDTMAVANQPISRAKRVQLRREAVLAYIESKPAGTPIKTTTLISVAGLKSAGSGSKFINKMIEDGLISKRVSEESGWINCWTVLSHATYQPKTKRKKITVSRSSEAVKARRKKVLDLIDSKPAGQPIRLHEFGAVMGIESTGSIAGTLRKLQTDGYITREPATGFKTLYRYEVLKRDEEPAEEPKIEDQATNEPEVSPIQTEPDVIPEVAKPEPIIEYRLDMIDLKIKAKSFAWEYNTDSLREFIKWISQ